MQIVLTKPKDGLVGLTPLLLQDAGACWRVRACCTLYPVGQRLSYGTLDTPCTYTLILLGNLSESELKNALQKPRPSVNTPLGFRRGTVTRRWAYRFSNLRSVSGLSVLSSSSLQPPGLSNTNRLLSR